MGIEETGGEYDIPRPYIECGLGACEPKWIALGWTIASGVGCPTLVVLALDGKLSHLSLPLVPVITKIQLPKNKNLQKNN